MHLLSTACTAERREKSHYNVAGREETMSCEWVGGWEGASRGLHNTDKDTHVKGQFFVLEVWLYLKLNFQFRN